MSVKHAEYRLVPGWPDYRVGSDGSVWTSKLGANGGWRRMATPPYPVTLYPRVSLSQQNVRTDFTVHHLVLLAFVGPRPAGANVCRHLDGNPSNNSIENLKWGTFRENEADKAAHGRRPLGESVFGSKLTADKVKEIRRMHAAGISAYRLAKMFRVWHSTACRIVNRVTWKHL
jgi:hypothetical protein